jgi:hypothetical protein
MRSTVLGFLDRSSVVTFMTVEEFSSVFHLRRCFCKDHGTRLEQACMTLPAVGPGCADCEMAKIGRIRCVKCDDFSEWCLFSNLKLQCL